jgi:AraC-like DNA-binding protein
MSSPETVPPALDDLAWLGEVRDVHHPINPTQPLIVRSKTVQNGGARYLPTVPHPEQHPYCELGILLEGKIVQFVGSEKIERRPGSLQLFGPGMPHYGLHLTYPFRAITVHFLPILLLEMGPRSDGARLLSRFTVSRTLKEAVLQPPSALRRGVEELFVQMAEEYSQEKIGSELRLRALLMEILVRILRWEQGAKKGAASFLDQPNWIQIERALRFIHEHFAEPLYVDQVARAAGLSVSRLQSMFREALGMSCVHYLRAYRISQAKALLCVSEARVTEVALAVGFDTLSHFNTSFRSLIGMSPTEYVHSNQRKRS